MIRGDNGAIGINLMSANGNIGSENAPLIVSENPMIVTGYDADAYGINVIADGNIFAHITKNDMGETAAGGSSIHAEDNAYGISLTSSNGNLGSVDNPIIVSGNPVAVTVTGSGGGATESAYGIRLSATGGSSEVFAAITGNDLSYDISAEDYAYGIYVFNPSGGIGAEGSPIIISGNPITTTTSVDQSLGMFLLSGLDLFANIVDNDLSNGIEGADYVAGIHLYSSGGSIGSETTPVIIAGNPITVNGPYAGTDSYGMYLDANGVGSNIFAHIIGNDMSGGVYGVDTAHGIYMEANNMGSATNPVIVYGNPMTVTADTSNAGSVAHGIYLNSIDTLFASITGNDMSNGISANTEVYGIRLNSANGNIGSDLNPVIISKNLIKATTDTTVVGSDAYGIWLQAPAAAAGNIFASITGNDMSNTITGADHVYGMYILGNSVGSTTNPLLISGNTIAATSTGNEGYGVYVQSPGDIYGYITGNDMMNSIQGDDRAWGINVYSSGGSLGSATTPFVISRNLINASAGNSTAVGISLHGAVDVFTSMLSNYMEVTSASANAYGGYVIAGNLIGNVGSIATFFNDNSGEIDGAIDTYMLFLNTGNVGGGNYVMWYGNTLIPAGGAWNGSYGPNNEVEQNFGAGDTIMP
jgi:hypothetical protein